MCPSPHLWYLHAKQRIFQFSMCSRPHLWFCACKTATLGLELQVSVGARSHLQFLHAKQRE